MTNTLLNRFDSTRIESWNAPLRADLHEDYQALGKSLARRGVDIEQITAAAEAFSIAVPSWAVGTGGTRFGRFPIAGEPRHVYDKLDDCAVINHLSGITPAVSLHFPWDDVSDPSELKAFAKDRGLRFDAVNSNTFQDHPGDSQHPLSYKYGSLSHSDKAVRDQAVAYNIYCAKIAEKLDSSALTIWVGDGSNFPGQQDFTKAFERYIESVSSVYAGVPENFYLFLEHKMYEPAFYSTVIQDWGSSLLAAQAVGERCLCLVDLGHHAPNVNIELIVARLIHAKKLAGFHFNDSKYGDDDLDAGSIDPYRLFLVFHELVNAQLRQGKSFSPSYMLDQSHNVTDPIESLVTSAIAVQRAYIQALLVDRKALAEFQEANDPLMASETLKLAFTTDVQPILKMARLRQHAAIDPVAAYRASGYRQEIATIRPAKQGGSGGIV